MTNGKFIICEISTNKYQFSLKACNGQVVATGQSYPTSSQCSRDIELVKQHVGHAVIEDLTISKKQAQPYPKFEVFLDEKGLFRFCMKNSEDSVLLLGDGYRAKASCLNGIDSIRRNAPCAPVHQ